MCQARVNSTRSSVGLWHRAEWGAQTAAGAKFTLPLPGRQILQPVQRAGEKGALKKLAAGWGGGGRRSSTVVRVLCKVPECSADTAPTLCQVPGCAGQEL